MQIRTIWYFWIKIDSFGTFDFISFEKMKIRPLSSSSLIAALSFCLVGPAFCTVALAAFTSVTSTVRQISRTKEEEDKIKEGVILSLQKNFTKIAQKYFSTLKRIQLQEFIKLKF